MTEAAGNAELLCDSLCVFLDILGFTEVIKRIEETGSEEDFARLHEAYSTGIAQLHTSRSDRGTRGFQWEIRTFTDNVFLSFPLSSNDGEVELGFLVEDVARFQLHLANRGYFTRGGLSLGRNFIDESMIFGPALVEAYQLESRMARDPRIVLGPTVAELVQQQIGYYDPPHSAPQNSEFLRDADGQIFINYLEAAIVDTDNGPQLNMEMMEAHRERIEAGLRSNVATPQVWSKYRWLASYHNWFLDSAFEHGYTHDATFVDHSLAAAHPQRIHRSPHDPEIEED
ncbi:MAG: hypothetical protein R3F19_08930 [Verrucomicrobiales bacterium]